MTVGCRDSLPRRVPRAQRAEQLLDVTLSLIAERGYGKVSIKAIADAAGVSKPIVYRIYPNLHALLLALVRREQRRVEAVLKRIVPRDAGGRSPQVLMSESLEAILDAVSEHPLTWRLVLLPPESTPDTVRALVERRREATIRRARALVRWGYGYIDAEAPPDEDVLARVLVSFAQEYARILLEREAEPETLLRSARALLAALPWRDVTPV